MSRIRTLDISELNDRLDELSTLRDTRNEASAALTEAQKALEERDRTNEVAFQELAAAVEAAQEAYDNALSDYGDDEVKELEALEALKGEIGERRGKINDEHGPFVHSDDFEDYARELAEELGCIPDENRWPCTCIDWERAARELQADYSTITWDGDDYLYRS